MLLTIKPKGVDFWDNTYKMKAEKIKESGKYDIVFNAGFFNFSDFSCCYAQKCNGKVLSGDIYTCSKYGYGWNDGEIPRVMEAETALKAKTVNNFISAIWAVLDGKAYPLDLPYADCVGMKTYMGMTADNHMVIGCEAVKAKEAQDRLIVNGCISGMILDGGGSSQCLTNGECAESSRIVRTLICVDVEEETKTSDIIETNLKFGTLYNLDPVTHIVLHHAAGNGTVEAIHNYHKNVKGWAGIAYHLYVRKDGKIYRGRPISKRGGHVEGQNSHTVGICFEGNFENETMSAAQIEGGRKAVEYCKSIYPSAEIVPHKYFGGTVCPGANFPFAAVVEPETNEAEPEQSEKASAWARTAWDWAIAKGLVDGTNPQGNLTREMAATLLYRFSQL